MTYVHDCMFCNQIMNYEQKGFYAKHLHSVILVMVLSPKQKKCPKLEFKIIKYVKKCDLSSGFYTVYSCD